MVTVGMLSHTEGEFTLQQSRSLFQVKMSGCGWGANRGTCVLFQGLVGGWEDGLAWAGEGVGKQMAAESGG